MNAALNREQFRFIQSLMESNTGIHLAEHKRIMVENRLASRLKANRCHSYDDYLAVLNGNDNEGELQCFIDRLTTHETRFFRESFQFEQLSKLVENWQSSIPIKVWSAACSTGEEVYSLAMLLESVLGSAKWSVHGTDISEAAIQQATRCQYDVLLAEPIPASFRRAYCLKGVGEFQGHFTINQSLRRFCHFSKQNLLAPEHEHRFDIVFLRNVLIYFDIPKQKHILNNVISRLHLGGYLFLGHSENVLKGHAKMEFVENCLYRKVAE